MKLRPAIFSLILAAALQVSCSRTAVPDLSAIKEPRILVGNDTLAFRDPAAVYNDGVFHLFFSMVRIEADSIFSYVATSSSRNLRDWSEPRILTARDQSLSYSSPGDVIRFGDEWVICFQTYPRPGYVRSEMPRYGNENARLFIMRSRDLENWSEPELLKVKGDTPEEEMGRMIDPYLVEDRDEPGKWWCFYKQNGVSSSWSYDLINWTYDKHIPGGENVCILRDGNGYVMFHSPQNGIGIKRSSDLRNWSDVEPLVTLGQDGWEWAKGRITAGFVLDCRDVPSVRKYIMFLHGSGPFKETEGDFDKNSSIGIAWSDDLSSWSWPGKGR
ncbi:MAG: hypothetical protein II151_05450 [Bacteroidales bacterium]|nr:hypothetical protein [Bacteroidales bacterium]